jgi:hypothetical protein
MNYEQINNILNVLGRTSGPFRLGYYVNLNESYTIDANMKSTEKLIDDKFRLNITQINANITNPSNTKIFFNADVVKAVDNYYKTIGQNINAYSSYFDGTDANNYKMWSRLKINPTISGVLSELSDRLKPGNLTTQTDYLTMFSTTQANIAHMNYVPFLTVRDIPVTILLALDSFVLTPNNSGVANITPLKTLFPFITFFLNLIDYDEQPHYLSIGVNAAMDPTNPAWIGYKPYIVKKELYRRIATELGSDIDYFNALPAAAGVTLNVSYMFKQTPTYPLYSDCTTYPTIHDVQTSYNGDEIDSATNGSNSGNTNTNLEWITNTYIKLYKRLLQDFQSVSGMTNSIYNAVLGLINDVINGFLAFDRTYIINKYTAPNTDVAYLLTSGWQYGFLSSTIYHKIQKQNIITYNNLFNSILLSKSHYKNNLGGNGMQIYNRVQNTFSSNDLFVLSIKNICDAYINSNNADILLDLNNIQKNIHLFIISSVVTNIISNLTQATYDIQTNIGGTTFASKLTDIILPQLLLNYILLYREFVLKDALVYAEYSTYNVNTIIQGIIKTFKSFCYDEISNLYTRFATQLYTFSNQTICYISQFISDNKNNYNFFNIQTYNPTDDIIYVKDMQKYYDAMYVQYNNYKNILNIITEGPFIQVYKRDPITHNKVIPQQILFKTLETYYYEDMDVIAYYYMDNSTIKFIPTITDLYIAGNATSIVNDTQHIISLTKTAAYLTYTDLNTGFIEDRQIYYEPLFTDPVFTLIQTFGANNELKKWYVKYVQPLTTLEKTTLCTYFSEVIESITPLYLFKNVVTKYTREDTIFIFLNIILSRTRLKHLNMKSTYDFIDLYYITDIIELQKQINKLINFDFANSAIDTGFKYPIIYDNDIIIYDDPNIKRNNLSLETEILNMIYYDTIKPKFAWAKELGHRIMDYISIEIGGMEIERYTPELTHMHYGLHKIADQERGYNIMIGNTPLIYNYSNLDKNKISLIIPLNFWFCKEPGLVLPLISLIHTDIDIKMRLAELYKILYVEENAIIKRIPKPTCSILAQYIYVDDLERVNIVKRKAEYLIPRYIHNDEFLLSASTITNQTNNVVTIAENNTKIFSYSLNLYDPIKYLIWCVKIHKMDRNDVLNWNTFGYYNTNNNNEIIFDANNNINRYDLTNNMLINQIFKQIKIQFNGKDRVAYRDEIFFNHVVPYSRKTGSLQDGEYMYSFSLYPLDNQPSGSANFSLFEECALEFELDDAIYNKIQNNEIQLSIKLWGCSINVLRVMSGMAGLAFV